MQDNTESSYNSPSIRFQKAIWKRLQRPFLLEHLDHLKIEIHKTFLPFLEPKGKVILITPQKRGQASGSTLVEMVGSHEQSAPLHAFGLKLKSFYSFAFMRHLGPYFIYNEFVSVWREES